jgi:Holliday junction resolvasome RuvABC endonuclease subunit
VKILALDLATRTGWAHSSGPSGTWDLSVRRDESGGMRLVRFQGKLGEMLRAAGIDLIVFEVPGFVGPGQMSAAFQSELQGVLKLWCESGGEPIEYRGYAPKEIKKHATGKGNANKEMMLAAARAKWVDRTIGSDHEADALWLLDLTQKELGVEPTR